MRVNGSATTRLITLMGGPVDGLEISLEAHWPVPDAWEIGWGAEHLVYVRQEGPPPAGLPVWFFFRGRRPCSCEEKDQGLPRGVPG